MGGAPARPLRPLHDRALGALLVLRNGCACAATAQPACRGARTAPSPLRRAARAVPQLGRPRAVKIRACRGCAHDPPAAASLTIPPNRPPCCAVPCPQSEMYGASLVRTLVGDPRTEEEIQALSSQLWGAYVFLAYVSPCAPPHPHPSSPRRPRMFPRPPGWAAA